ncbi:glycerol-3-phosphate dehydrogenase/oxidase [Streptomyces sp. 7N604]|uniref:glycerol-3-phosphate dehydrogenase/oxidase n=1 Tax=Streptomyces sp. 7N604 TaxID=3457415 RepID=UPI003FD3DE91
MRDALAEQRILTRETLGRGTFDLVVIGGGIVGISIAWMAARSGLRAAVVDKGDFASATSSASSKLAHGGLRYLAMGNVKLVHENHTERRALGNYAAPHHVRRLPFLVPLYSGGPHGRLKIGAGMVTYSALSLFNDGVGRVISPSRAREYVPALRTENLRACGLYWDHQMSDARLAMTAARAAAEAGAVLLNHAEVMGLRRTSGRVGGVELRDCLDGTEFGVDAKVVVNATGPWVDHLRRMEDPGAAPSVRLSKGAHLVARQNGPHRAAITVPIDDVRVSFAIPWEDHLLVGTTDEEYLGDPAGVTATDADVDQILGEIGQAIPDGQLSRSDIVYSFAGLRVLPGGSGDTKNAKRETVVSVGSGGMVSVAGGKWTTFRHIGTMVLQRIRHLLPDLQVERGPALLPGAAQPEPVHRLVRASMPELPEDVTAHLVRHYGTRSHELLALGVKDPGLLERVHPDGPDIWAQVAYAIDREWGYDVDDVLRRRTTLAVRGLDTPEIRKRVSELIGT